MPEKVAIVGSRDYPLLQEVWRYVRRLPIGTVVVSGGARGVDTSAENAAKNSPYYGVETYPADWDRHGEAAGHIRNKQIVNASDRLVAFWDGNSNDTKDSIELAQKAGKPVLVFGPDGKEMNLNA